MTGRPIGEPTWSPAGEGEQLWFVGTLATIRVPGEAVGGRYALIEFLFPRGASPPRHTHPQDESYIVVDGQLTVQAGERRFELGPGGTAAVPMGVAHTFRVDSETARVGDWICRPRRVYVLLAAARFGGQDRRTARVLHPDAWRDSSKVRIDRFTRTDLI